MNCKEGKEPRSTVEFANVRWLGIISIWASSRLSSTNGINKDTEMWLLHFYMKRAGGAALISSKCMSSLSLGCQERKLTPYCQAVSYLFMTYVANDIVAEADIEIDILKQSPNQM